MKHFERGDPAAAAVMNGPRQQLFPGLAGAYRAWCEGDGGAALQQACVIPADQTLKFTWISPRI